MAAANPQYFVSITTFPGYLNNNTPDRMAAIAPLCISMFAGALDPGLAAQRARDSLGLDGVTGSVSIAGNVVTVSATAHVDYILLPGGGDVHGQASAAPFRGITSGSAG